tara:strand:+ start:494 stop:724 length:231 start_codon:yes stop_codon:yes gene_type:complete
MSSTAVYSVTLSNQNRLNIIDAVSGRILNNIQFTGTLINGPVVVGDKCTLVVDNNGKRKGHVHQLPTGRLTQTFQV